MEREGNLLGYLGRLSEYNGIDISLESLVHLKEKIPDIKLLVVGGGEIPVQKYTKMAEDLGVNTYVVRQSSDARPIYHQSANLLKACETDLSVITVDKLNPSHVKLL